MEKETRCCPPFSFSFSFSPPKDENPRISSYGSTTPLLLVVVLLLLLLLLPLSTSLLLLNSTNNKNRRGLWVCRRLWPALRTYPWWLWRAVEEEEERRRRRRFWQVTDPASDRVPRWLRLRPTTPAQNRSNLALRTPSASSSVYITGGKVYIMPALVYIMAGKWVYILPALGVHYDSERCNYGPEAAIWECGILTRKLVILPSEGDYRPMWPHYYPPMHQFEKSPFWVFISLKPNSASNGFWVDLEEKKLGFYFFFCPFFLVLPHTYPPLSTYLPHSIPLPTH